MGESILGGGAGVIGSIGLMVKNVKHFEIITENTSNFYIGSNIIKMNILCIGGGGWGSLNGGGGGGGNINIINNFDINNHRYESIQINIGNAGGYDGSGGTTIYGSYISATGGSPGVYNGKGGDGGSGGGGYIGDGGRGYFGGGGGSGGGNGGHKIAVCEQLNLKKWNIFNGQYKIVVSGKSK